QDGNVIQELDRTGVPLGILDGGTWQQKVVHLAPGDVLLLYTDGITEAQNAQEAFFDEDRLREVVRANLGRSARDIQDSVIAKVDAFVNGIGYFLNQAFGISPVIGAVFAAVVVVSFAATTMDTGLRLQKYVTAEFGDILNLPVLKVGWVATLIAAGTTAFLALHDGEGKGGLIIWPLFGTTNQLLASLALLVISVFLKKLRRPTIYTLAPMVFLLLMTAVAMLITLKDFWVGNKWGLFIVGAIILVSASYMVVEAVHILRGPRPAKEVEAGAGG
ncbi:MAG: SpoIIE family protein phosphatase, partial [Deltaproteobacteria bacterium]|nr:SpoIIE family protein phosphatase [Deltaproteobacteria bacterium]